MVRQLYLFSYYYVLMLLHSWAGFSFSKVFKVAVFLMLGLGFILFDFFFFWRIISQVMSMPELGELRYSFIIRLLNMVFILFLGMVLFSNIVTSLSTFFLSDDLSLLLSAPTQLNALFIHKFIQTYLNSSWMVLLFGFPIFMAYGLVLDAAWWYYPLLILLIIPFLMVPASLGVMITLLLMRFFPANRTHQVIASLGIFFGAGIVIVIRLLRPEEFMKPISAERLSFYVDSLRIPSSPLLPSTWVSESMMGAIEQRWDLFQENFILLLISSFGLTYLTYLMVRSFYFMAYSRSQEGGGALRSVNRRRGLFVEKMYSRLRPQVAAFFIKDTKTFFRETTQWSQLFLLAAIVFVYLFNVRTVPIYSWFLANFAGFLNVGMAGFVLSALCARFVFPAVSLEGRAFWVVRHAPIRYGHFLMQKFFFYLIPLLLLGEGLIIISNYFLHVDAYMQGLSMFMIFVITLAQVGMGVGFGSIFPRFKVDNAAQIAVGTGGILYMIVSLFYLLVVIVLEASPVYMHFKGLISNRVFSFEETLIFHGGVVLISLLLTILPMYFGLRKLHQLEI